MARETSGRDGVLIPPALHPDDLLDIALSDTGQVVVHPRCRPQARACIHHVLVGTKGMAQHEPSSQIWCLHRELRSQSVRALEAMFGPETAARIVAGVEAAVNADAVLPVD